MYSFAMPPNVYPPNSLPPPYYPLSPPDEMTLFSAESGIVFGRTIWGRVGLRFYSEGNVLLIGGPGSGKSSSIIMPTLSAWDGPFVAVDIKGELEAHYLQSPKNGRKIIVLNPDDPDSLSVDPFEWLDDGGEDNLLSNLTAMSAIIIPSSPHLPDPFWVESERSVLTAALLCYYHVGLSFPQAVIRILDLSLKDLCDELEKSPDIRVMHLLGKLRSMKNETVASIERGLRNKLLLLANEDPLLHFFRGKRESAPTFCWNELEDSVVFIRIPQERVERWGTGVTLLLTMALRHLMRRPEMYSPAAERIAPCLVAIDEFARLGRLPEIASALATLRSKAVNLLLSVQSLSQLDSLYGQQDRATILDCCSYRVILRVADPVNQRLIAGMIGTIPEYVPSMSVTYNIYGYPISFGQQIGIQRTYIIQPADLARLNGVIIASPDGTFIVQKLPPMLPPADCQPRISPSKARERFCPVRQRSSDARARVQVYLSRLLSACDDPEAIAMHLGKTLQCYFPELLLPAAGDDVEKIFRVIAADPYLIDDLTQRAVKLDYQD